MGGGVSQRRLGRDILSLKTSSRRAEKQGAKGVSFGLRTCESWSEGRRGPRRASEGSVKGLDNILGPGGLEMFRKKKLDQITEKKDTGQKLLG